MYLKEENLSFFRDNMVQTVHNEKLYTSVEQH